MSIQRINYPFLTPPVGPYCHAVKHNQTLYLSGLTAFGYPQQNDSTLEQIQCLYEQMQKIVECEGISLQNLIKVTLYVTDLSDMQCIRQSLLDYYGDHIPASTLVPVPMLFSPDINIEMEAILALD